MENTLKFGMWSVIEQTGRKWLCQCDCGVIRHVVYADLIAERSKGCGCARLIRMRAAQKLAVTKHGMRDSPEMRIWVDMRRRCYQPHRPDFHNYGGRGIYVCDRWRTSFVNFFADMGLRPDGKTLDRKDNDGPYSPENCAWADAKQQGANRRTNVRRSFFGEMLTLPEAAERYGIGAATIRSRICLYHWTPEDAVTKPVR